MVSEAKRSISSTRTVGAFVNGRACSDTLLYVINRAFGYPLTDEERAAVSFAGGMMQHGYQCGMIWGATLAAGAQAYRLFGPGPQAETMAVLAAQRLVESFRAQNRHTDCFEITEINKSSSTGKLVSFFLLKGGVIGCLRMSARYAPVAYREINAALSAEPIAAPPAPASCAAMLAHRMGMSDLHAVMAAGLAGGIGLSGGACGALGAAIWIIGMNRLKEGADKIARQDPAVLAVIERFIKSANYEFECPKIVGRRFESVDDHAGYLRQGGCAKIIEALAAKPSD